MRSADIDRGDLAGARGALDVPDDRDFASLGLVITIYAEDSDLHPLTYPDGVLSKARRSSSAGRLTFSRHMDELNPYGSM